MMLIVIQLLQARSEDDGPIMIDLLTGATDDDGDDLSVTNVVGTFIDNDGNTGTVNVSVDSNGVATIDPSDFNGLGDGDSADITIEFDVEDGNGGTVGNTATVSEDDGPIMIDLLTGASDDDGDDLTVTNVVGMFIDNDGNTGTVNVSVDPNGVATIAPSDFNDLGDGDSADITIDFDIEDGNGGTVPNTATVTINGTNDIAVIGGVSVGAVSEDTSEFGVQLDNPGGSDFFGADVNVSGDGNTFVVGTIFSNTAHIYNVDGTLLASVTSPNSITGSVRTSVSISEDGNTILFGAAQDAPNFVETGYAALYDRSGTLITEFSHPDLDFNDRFGFTTDVTADGNTIIIGSPGEDGGTVFLFDRDGTLISTLQPQGGSFGFGGAGNAAGGSIAISDDGELIVAGAQFDNANGPASGAGFIFNRDGTQIAKFTPANVGASDQFGDNITISGDGSTIVASSIIRGEVYVFDATGAEISSFTDISVGLSATTLEVSNDGSTIVVNGFGDDEDGFNAGAALVFDRDGNQLARLTDFDGLADALFGISVSISSDGATIVVTSFEPSRIGNGHTFIRNAEGNYVDSQGNIYGPNGVIGQAVEGIGGIANGTLTITDVDNGEAFFQEIAAGTEGDNGLGTFELTADGNWTFTLDNGNPAVQALANGQSTTETITVTSLDGSATQVIEVTINGTNDDPTVAAALTAAADEDDAGFSIDLLAGAADVNTGTTLNVANVMGLVAGVTLNGNALDVDPSDPAFQSPAEGEELDIEVTYDIEDSDGGSIAQTATITITGTNDAPTITEATLAATEDGGVFSVDLAPFANDIDNGDTLNFAIPGSPSEGTAVFNGSVLEFNTGTTFQDLGAGDTRDIIVNTSVTDQNAGVDTSQVTVTVTGVNDDATIGGVATGSVAEDGAEFGERLAASNGASNDGFGAGLALGFFTQALSASADGNIIVVGADRDDDNGSNSGSVYLFDGEGNELRQLTASDAEGNDFFGVSAAVSGDGSTIAVGALNSSAVYLYENDGTEREIITTSSISSTSTQFLTLGASVGVSDDGQLIVAGVSNDEIGGVQTGAAYVFDGSGTELF